MKKNWRDTVLLSLMGPLMFVLGDLAFEVLPNIHLVGVLLAVITAVYRGKAIFPLYVYVFLNGLYSGFALWWVPYLYVWLPLWGAVLLVPRRLSPRWYVVWLIALCAAHGYLFGILYAPGQAVLFGLGWKQTLAWIVTGLVLADSIHGTSNLILGAALIPPLYKVLQKLKEAKEV